RECPRQTRFLSQDPLQRARPRRAGCRQVQALQTHRLTLREDCTELCRLHLACGHVYLGQIRAHGLSLSRIIITKDQGASLDHDVSHSRPHRVMVSSDFDVLPAFERSIRKVRRLLLLAPPPGNADVRLGDARSLKSIGNGTVDAVLTSPPYLNAIDYIRGHRLSLIWLGYKVSDLREI